jgi:multidrug resistance efflux pump
MAVKVNGKVVAKKRLELKFRSSGKIKELFVSVGDRVKKGQVLAKLDDSPIQNQLDIALLDYRKTRNKFDETPDEDKQKKQQAQIDLDSSVKEVEAAKHELDQLELKSPIDGVVESIENLYPDLNITPGTQTVTVVNPDSLTFVADVPEKDIPTVKVGQFAKIVLDAYPNNTIGGQVLSVGIVPNSSKEVSYPVTIELPKQDNLKIGLSGTATII